jgi:hypothetical protein
MLFKAVWRSEWAPAIINIRFLTRYLFAQRQSSSATGLANSSLGAIALSILHVPYLFMRGFDFDLIVHID